MLVIRQQMSPTGHKPVFLLQKIYHEGGGGGIGMRYLSKALALVAILTLVGNPLSVGRMRCYRLLSLLVVVAMLLGLFPAAAWAAAPQPPHRFYGTVSVTNGEEPGAICRDIGALASFLRSRVTIASGTCWMESSKYRLSPYCSWKRSFRASS